MPYTPWTTRKFGVEMEMRTVRNNGQPLTLNAIAAALTASCTMRVRNAGGYGHSDGTVWDVKTDGSCGFEVAGPALMMNEEQHCDELRRGCSAINSLPPKVDRTCGLHVHVDCSDFTWNELQTLVSLWCRYEPFFFSMIPPVRRTNQYCQAIRKHTHGAADANTWSAAQRFLQASDQHTARTIASTIARYHGLNFMGWFRHGRVEFRLHSGTTDYDKIRRWSSLVMSFAHRVKNADMPPVGRLLQSQSIDFPTRYVGKVLGLIATPEMPDVPPVSGELIRWIDSRRAQFDPTAAAAAAADRHRPRNQGVPA